MSPSSDSFHEEVDVWRCINCTKVGFRPTLLGKISRITGELIIREKSQISFQGEGIVRVICRQCSRENLRIIASRPASS